MPRAPHYRDIKINIITQDTLKNRRTDEFFTSQMVIVFTLLVLNSVKTTFDV